MSYPGISGQKLKPFSKIDFSDSESGISDILNMIDSSKILVFGDGFLLVVDHSVNVAFI